MLDNDHNRFCSLFQIIVGFCIFFNRVGSLGDSTCSNFARRPPLCYGDNDGLGTYARYNTISGLSLLVDASGNDRYLFITDTVNNKIRQVDLTTGPAGSSFPSTTFDSNVDTRANGLTGIAANSRTNTLFVSVTGGVYSYSIAVGPSSKTIYIGRLMDSMGMLLICCMIFMIIFTLRSSILYNFMAMHHISTLCTLT